MINGVILGGKRTAQNQLLEFAGVEHKAFIEIDGKTMIQHVIDAMNESRYIENIYVVMPEQFKEVSFDSKKSLEFIPCGDTVAENHLIAIHRSGVAENVVVATCDIPLFRGFMLDDFIQRCLSFDAVFYFSFAKESAIKAKYPQVVRTYVRSKDEGYTGANVYLVDKKRFATEDKTLEKIVAKIDFYRKKPWKYYIQLLGWPLFLKLALKRFRLEEMEARASKILGCRFKAILMPYPECGIDVDKVSDLIFVRELVRKKGWPRMESQK